jgi:hypothetical protein
MKMNGYLKIYGYQNNLKTYIQTSDYGMSIEFGFSDFGFDEKYDSRK